MALLLVCVAACTAAAALVVFAPAWTHSKHVITLLHEAGHSGVGLLTGRRLSGLKVHSDGSGVTHTSGNPHDISTTVTLLAGYPGPALAAVAIAMTAPRWPAATAFALLAVAVILLAVARSLFTVIPVAVIAGLAGLAAWSATSGWPLLASGLLITLAALAATGAIRSTIDLLRIHKTGPGHGIGSDADQLAHRVGGTPAAWSWAFTAVTASCAFTTGYILIAAAVNP